MQRMVSKQPFQKPNKSLMVLKSISTFIPCSSKSGHFESAKSWQCKCKSVGWPIVFLENDDKIICVLSKCALSGKLVDLRHAALRGDGGKRGIAFMMTTELNLHQPRPTTF